MNDLCSVKDNADEAKDVAVELLASDHEVDVNDAITRVSRTTRTGTRLTRIAMALAMGTHCRN